MAAKTWNHRTLRLSHSRMEEVNWPTPRADGKLQQNPSDSYLIPTSASPVGRVAIRAQKQRYMQLSLAFSDTKGDFDDGIERFTFLRFVIAHSVERQTVRTRQQIFPFGQQLRAAAVAVGALRC